MKKTETGMAEVLWSGSGSEIDPYLIENLIDLIALRANVELGKSFENKFFRQDADIEFPSNEDWSPIGEDSDHAFRGTYSGLGNDGNIHILSNFRISSKTSYLGMFGCLGSEGKICNLGVRNISFKSLSDHESVAGGIVGCSWGSVENSFSINITHNLKGGIVGGIAGTVIDLTSEKKRGETGGRITGSFCVGCIENDTVNCIGGIAGHNQGNISACYFTGSIKSGAAAIGGIAGICTYDEEAGPRNNTGIFACYNTGYINGNENFSGAICGTCKDDKVEVADCFFLNGTIKKNNKYGCGVELGEMFTPQFLDKLNKGGRNIFELMPDDDSVHYTPYVKYFLNKTDLFTLKESVWPVLITNEFNEVYGTDLQLNAKWKIQNAEKGTLECCGHRYEDINMEETNATVVVSADKSVDFKFTVSPRDHKIFKSILINYVKGPVILSFKLEYVGSSNRLDSDVEGFIDPVFINRADYSEGLWISYKDEPGWPYQYSWSVKLSENVTLSDGRITYGPYLYSKGSCDVVGAAPIKSTITAKGDDGRETKYTL